MRRKIALFTAHSPLAGGGSVILRSLVENLPELAVSWLYLAERVASGHELGYLGQGFMGGPILRDIYQTWQMLACAPSPRVIRVVKRLLETDSECFWIVSHNEGLRVAIELARQQSERRVHLTFHDDWSGAICARSRRYRFFGNVARRLTITALRAVSSYDVICSGMQDYYQNISGKNGMVCHRYLPTGFTRSMPLGPITRSENVRIGHVGSIYNKSDLFCFLAVLRDYGHANSRTMVLNMWGCHLKNEDIPAPLRSNICFHADLPESQVITELRGCDFAYAMYPSAERLRLFGRTSFPTKLTTYVQAMCPILGQGPSDSTLAQFLDATDTGVAWSGEDHQAGLLAVARMLALRPGVEQWEAARQHYFGGQNLATMRRVFLPS